MDGCLSCDRDGICCRIEVPFFVASSFSVRAVENEGGVGSSEANLAESLLDSLRTLSGGLLEFFSHADEYSPRGYAVITENIKKIDH